MDSYIHEKTVGQYYFRTLFKQQPRARLNFIIDAKCLLVGGGMFKSSQDVLGNQTVSIHLTEISIRLIKKHSTAKCR